MTFVEHDSYPPLIWATDISVTQNGNELVVYGEAPFSDEQRQFAPDVFREYRRAGRLQRAQKGAAKESPHLQFANAATDQDLVRFIGRFGPVVAKSYYVLDVADSDLGGCIELLGFGQVRFRNSGVFRVAYQDLNELKRERDLYRAAVALVDELKNGKQADVKRIHECISAVVEGLIAWPHQWLRERRLRVAAQCASLEPTWTFGEDDVQAVETFRAWASSKSPRDRSRNPFSGLDSIRAGHLIICEIANSFPPILELWGDIPIEATHWDLSCGIRPVLYYILRREYLRKVRSIGTCLNTDCRQFFEIERSGQVFCSEECSRRQRQREYWRTRGKPLRQQRREQRVSKNRRREHS
jgi:hypothetical protein